MGILLQRMDEHLACNHPAEHGRHRDPGHRRDHHGDRTIHIDMIIETNSPLPAHPRPIILIGAGGIVNDAHLPAYKIAGFRVAGIYDIDREKALATARKFDIPLVYYSMEDMLARSPGSVVFDVAVPGAQILPVLQQLPEGAFVLIQKPMGEDLAMAKEILGLVKTRHMTAGVNF